MTRRAGLTVRLPGANTTPVTSTKMWFQTGAVKHERNTDSQPVRTGGIRDGSDAVLAPGRCDAIAVVESSHGRAARVPPPDQQFSMRLSRVCAGMVCRVGGDVAAPTPHRPGRADLPSRPGEFHPEPLTDPDMNLSIHPARAIHRRLPPSVEIGGLLRSPVGPSLQRGWPPPFAPWALPHFSTTTEESAPAWLVGISASRISRLCLFPWHRQTGSQVPCKSLDKIHAFYTPDTAWPVCRSPPRQGNRTSNLLDTGGVLLGSGVIDSTSRRVGHARGGHDGSVCRVLGGSGGPANRECRAARLL